MSKQASATISKASELKFNADSFDLAAYLQAKGAIAAVIPAEVNVRTPEQIIKELFALPAPDIRDLYIRAFGDNQPIELTSGASTEDYQIIIRAAYKQVFGNAHLMESERSLEAESQLCSGRISVMEFIRQLAKSDHYRKLFFEKCPNVRFVELNFKHLLGRAPENAAEISEHIKIIAEGGFEAEIDSYIDSDEYFQSFGTIIVPYHRIYANETNNAQTDNGLVGYTHLFKLLQGACSSDKSNSIDASPQLQTSLFNNSASEVTLLSTVPKTAPSVSPFEVSISDLVESAESKAEEAPTKPVAEPTTFTIAETQDKEAAAFGAWRAQFEELLDEEFVPDNAVETRVREAGRNAKAGRRFNPQGFDLASYLQQQEAATRVPITEAKTQPEVASKYTNAFRDRDIVEFAQNNSVEDLDLVVEAAYKQVFGNAYIMESERVGEAESQLRSGRISVMEFVRQLAKSDHYRTLFFERCTNLRAIELNFKHLLGRAPANAAEISEHIQIIAAGGFEAEIDSYLDSDEYFENFGTKVVPYYRGYDSQTASTLAAYTNSFSILRGACSSDKSTLGGTAPILQRSLLSNSASNISDISSVPESFERLSPVGELEFQSQEYFFPDRLEFPDINVGIPAYKSSEFLASRAERRQPVKTGIAFPVPDYNEPTKLFNGASGEDISLVITAAYKQVFGNVHLMESQRLVSAESRLISGQLTVKEFVRELATSELYRSLFFDSVSNLRAVELNFKHLLGRAPENAAEISQHIQIIAEGGFTAEIDSYLDSEEYKENFGDDIVPYYIGGKTQTGKTLAGYTRIFQLLKGACSSDRSLSANNSSPIQRTLLKDQSSSIDFTSLDFQASPQAIEVKSFDTNGFNLAAYLQEQEAAKKAEQQEDVVEIVEPEIASNFTNAFSDIKPVEFILGASSVEDLDAIIANAYRQVFGNAYLMESERLPIAESQLRQGNISVREFVRQLATSDRYRSLFFDKFTNLRAIELNFKHLLGRAPESAQEISEHIKIIAESGFEAEINSYLDSDEYQTAFGENFVPYYRGYTSQVGSNLVGYTNSYQLLRGASTSDKASLGGAAPRLQSNLLKNNASKISPLSAAPDSTPAFNPLAVERPVPSTEEIIAKALGLPYTKPAVKPAFPEIIASATPKQAAPVKDTNDLIAKAVGLPEYRVIDPITTYVNRETQPVSKATEVYQKYETLRKENPVEFLPQAISTNYLNAANGKEPVVLNGSSGTAVDIVIEAAYKQVFGNVHLMESQRLTEAESQLRNREIDVAEFVGKLAKSELHRELFFNNCSNLRAIELNFKQLLGRAPESAQEISEHIVILAENGYEAEIDSYIYSEEYQENFGSDMVPYYRGFDTQTGSNVAAYTHSYELFKGASTSDRATAVASGARLQTSLFTGNPSQIHPLTSVPSGAPSISPFKRVAKTAATVSSNGTGDTNQYVPFTPAKATAPAEVSTNHLKAVADNQPVELINSGFGENLDLVIKAAYKQVFGNVHLMESQRLTEAESQLCDGSINVAEFVGKLAKSELYRDLFFNNCSNLRAIELNFKHLLGRAPASSQEISEHIKILADGGFDAEIDSYIYSDEYTQNFGYNIVPYFRGFTTQQANNIAGYTHSYELLRGTSSSDITNNASKLQSSLLANNPSTITPLSCFVEKVAPKQEPPAIRPDDLPTYVPRYQELEKPVSPKAITWQTQYNVLANASPVEFIPGSSDQEAEIVIRALYKQVLGNAYVMESERFPVAESQLKKGNISVREFVRMLAKSELYKSRFIDNCPRYRAHELNFKHLLGRAPDSYDETIYHSNILDAQGYEADIDSYLDSDEYQNAFGENIVPYYRGYKSQTGKNLLGYTNMFKMLPSISTSDKAGMSANSPRLAQALIYKNSGGSLPVTDINQLIRDALKPKAVSADDSAEIAQLKQECEEQSREIERLTAQLKEMEAISGFAYAGSWKPAVSSNVSITANTPGVCIIPGSLQEWQNRAQDLKDQVAAIQGKVSERRSLNAIAESRLNKWRTRFF